MNLCRLFQQKGQGRVFLLFSFSVLNVLFMHYYVFLNHYVEDIMLMYAFVCNLLTVTFDVSVVLLLFLLLTWKRLKPALLLTYATTLVWSFVNVFFVRFFNQYLPLSAMSQTGNLTDQAVMDSMMAGFQWSDLYYVVSLLLFVVVYRSVGALRLDKTIVLTFLLMPLLSIAGILSTYTVYHVMKSDTRGNSTLYQRRISELLYAGTGTAFPNKTRFETGCLRVLVAEVYDMLHALELTADQRETIRCEAADLSQRVTDGHAAPKVQNVVFIVLESFLSSPIDLKVDGKEITPFLNALKRSDDVYYNGRMAPNITMGESGDGQFIYMTGILPLRDKLTVGEAKSLSLPALPTLLSRKLQTRYREIVMPSPPQVWEQEKMNRVYGIEKMYCNRDVLGYVVDYLNDEQVFTLAMQSPFWQRQPFFSLVLSYSTHQPYRTPVDNSLTLHDASLPNGYKNYLIACHYADVWLQRYVDFLKQKGVYDNTLIVITADHHAHLDALGMGDKVSKDLPLFIVHGNIDNQQAWSGPINQLDVFTTLLDVLAIDSEWHGLGHSVLSPDYRNSLTDEAWQLSEWIIKGKYFQTK